MIPTSQKAHIQHTLFIFLQPVTTIVGFNIIRDFSIGETADTIITNSILIASNTASTTIIVGGYRRFTAIGIICLHITIAIIITVSTA